MPAPTALAAPFVAHPAAAVLLFDFDGTLSPIVDDPAAARLLDGLAGRLDDLAHRYRRVGVLSGRPLAFLAEHLPAALALSGSYGLESRIDGVVVDHPEAAWWRPVVADASAQVRSEAPDGVVVEDKGLSLTIHFRTRPEQGDAVTDLATRISAATGLEVRSAKMSVELHPPIEVDKGTAVRALASGAPAVLYAGDDVGDLPAFAALADLALTGVHVARIVVGGPEVPPALVRAADAVIDGVDAVPHLLDALLAAA